MMGSQKACQQPNHGSGGGYGGNLQGFRLRGKIVGMVSFCVAKNCTRKGCRWIWRGTRSERKGKL